MTTTSRMRRWSRRGWRREGFGRRSSGVAAACSTSARTGGSASKPKSEPAALPSLPGCSGSARRRRPRSRSGIEGTARIVEVRRWPDQETDLAAEGDATVLAGLGHEIGFHTAHHDLLTVAGPAAIADAMATGRPELEQALSSELRRFAYPHGKTSQVVADAVSGAGFAEAYTGSGRAVATGAHRHWLSRWEPGPLQPRRFAAEVAVRLNRSVDGPPR